MAMYRTSRSVITLIVAFSILLTVPMAAGARALETPRSTLAVAEGWLGTALDWLQEALSLHGRGGRHRSPAPPTSIQAQDGTTTSSSTGGSCIDPQGNPKPWCL